MLSWDSLLIEESLSSGTGALLVQGVIVEIQNFGRFTHGVTIETLLDKDVQFFFNVEELMKDLILVGVDFSHHFCILCVNVFDLFRGDLDVLDLLYSLKDELLVLKELLGLGLEVIFISLDLVLPLSKSIFNSFIL